MVAKTRARHPDRVGSKSESTVSPLVLAHHRLEGSVSRPASPPSAGSACAHRLLSALPSSVPRLMLPEGWVKVQHHTWRALGWNSLLGPAS